MSVRGQETARVALPTAPVNRLTAVLATGLQLHGSQISTDAKRKSDEVNPSADSVADANLFKDYTADDCAEEAEIYAERANNAVKYMLNEPNILEWKKVNSLKGKELNSLVGQKGRKYAEPARPPKAYKGVTKPTGALGAAQRSQDAAYKAKRQAEMASQPQATKLQYDSATKFARMFVFEAMEASNEAIELAKQAIHANKLYNEANEEKEAKKAEKEATKAEKEAKKAEKEATKAEKEAAKAKGKAVREAKKAMKDEVEAVKKANAVVSVQAHKDGSVDEIVDAFLRARLGDA